jgi:hypothetical protein
MATNFSALLNGDWAIGSSNEDAINRSCKTYVEWSDGSRSWEPTDEFMLSRGVGAKKYMMHDKLRDLAAAQGHRIYSNGTLLGHPGPGQPGCDVGPCVRNVVTTA